MTPADAWADIEAWLRGNAPATFASLPGAASEHALRDLEAHLGGALPGEIKDALLRHDGSGEFVLPGFHRFSSTDIIRREYVAWRTADERRIQQGTTKHAQNPGQYPRSLPGDHPLWHPRWIPVCHDESGNLLFVRVPDLGRVGALRGRPGLPGMAGSLIQQTRQIGRGDDRGRRRRRVTAQVRTRGFPQQGPFRSRIGDAFGRSTPRCP
ncbi:SMI1/KNR4 family protein [Streptomyces sp. NPDC050085]|uniref:SMI1/KNR4 family protein n=1 Tax=Streptomyces sp. NPDC050085 TaxID=3365600 RepID=UPI0037AAECBE